MRLAAGWHYLRLAGAAHRTNAGKDFHMHIIITYYSDGSGKPKVIFCETANGAICAVNNTNGANASVYEIDTTDETAGAVLISGDDLTV
jgi:hypothetical protein